MARAMQGHRKTSRSDRPRLEYVSRLTSALYQVVVAATENLNQRLAVAEDAVPLIRAEFAKKAHGAQNGSARLPSATPGRYRLRTPTARERWEDEDETQKVIRLVDEATNLKRQWDAATARVER
jgi:hypothetical protein